MRWPPFATTTLPEVFCAKVIVTVLSSVVTIDWGISKLSDESNTDTITFLVPKLCVTTLDVVLVNVSGLDASSAMVAVTLLSPDPSPLKKEAVTAFVTLRLLRVASEPLTINWLRLHQY